MVPGLLEKRVAFKGCEDNSKEIASGCTSPATSRDCDQQRSGKSFSSGASLRNSRSLDCSLTDDASSGSLPHPLLDVEDSTKLLRLVASNLETLISHNEVAAKMQQAAWLNTQPAATRPTVFHGLRQPPITLLNYLERLARYTKVSPVCFVFAVAYMDTLAERGADYQPVQLNVHRLLLTGLLLAAKLMDDRVFNNVFFARVGGISTSELNALELEMLSLLDFRLNVPAEAVRAYLGLLQASTLTLGAGAAAAAVAAAAAPPHAHPRDHARRTSSGSSGAVARKRRSSGCGAASSAVCDDAALCPDHAGAARAHRHSSRPEDVWGPAGTAPGGAGQGSGAGCASEGAQSCGGGSMSRRQSEGQVMMVS